MDVWWPTAKNAVTASGIKKNNIEVEIVIQKDETEFLKKLIEEKIKFYELGSQGSL